MSFIDPLLGGIKVIQNDGSPAAAQPNLNLILPAGSSVVNDPANRATNVTIVGGGNVAQFVVDLFAYKPTNARQVLLLDGYASTTDGGGGQFYWDSTYSGAGDNVTIIVPLYVGYTTGAWMRQWDKARLDVRWAGYLADVFDDANTARAQSALDACRGVYVCFFPKVGTYWYLTKPLIIHFANQVIEGKATSGSGSDTDSVLRNGNAMSFPLIWCGGSSYLSGSTPTFATRGGFEWFQLVESQTAPMLVYSQYPHTRINGQSAFCVETMINVTTAPSVGFGSIFTSYGGRSRSAVKTCAFQFKYNDLGGGNYGISVHLSTNGGSGSVTTHRTRTLNLKKGLVPTWEYDLATAGPQFAIGVDTKIAATFDGSTIRLFVGGVLQASLTVDNPGTETLLKYWWENVMLGPMYTSPFGAELIFYAGHHQLTGVRISKVARYTTGGPYPVETSPLTADSDTLMLHTFATVDRFENFIIGHTGIGLGDVYYEWQNCLAQSIGNITIRDINLQHSFGYTVSLQASPHWRLQNVSHEGIGGPDIHNNCYIGAMIGGFIYAALPGGFGFDAVSSWGGASMQRDTCGLVVIDGTQVRTSWQWCWVMMNNSDTRMFRNYALSGGEGNYYFGDTHIELENDFPTDEGGVIKTAAMLCNESSVLVTGGEVQNASGASYGSCFVLIDGGDQHTFDTEFNGDAAIPVFGFESAPTQPTVGEGTNTNGTFFTPLDMVDASRPGLVVRPSNQAGGLTPIDFPADADLTLTDNQWTRTGAIAFTDVAHPLSVPRNVIPPYLTVNGFIHSVFNDTTKTLTIGTVTIASGASARIGSKGGTIVAWP